MSEKKSDTDPNELERDLREWKKWVDISKELTATENERLQISANVVPALEQKLSEERARFSQCRDQADAVRFVSVSRLRQLLIKMRRLLARLMKRRGSKRSSRGSSRT